MDPDYDRQISDHVLRMHRWRAAGEQDGDGMLNSLLIGHYSKELPYFSVCIGHYSKALPYFSECTAIYIFPLKFDPCALLSDVLSVNKTLNSSLV